MFSIMHKKDYLPEQQQQQQHPPLPLPQKKAAAGEIPGGRLRRIAAP